jgi:hypothetical protein
MWINTEVDIPEELLRAQREGQLVVFAGAGISMGNPSNLPNFDKLADRIAGGALRREDGEPVDRFLGRLVDQGVNVEGIARQIIADPSSKHTAAHEHLVNLFPTLDCLRIVTTNFDRHFTTALANAYGSSAPVYVGPALPLGREFDGLVYLHGAIDNSHHRLVLTDGDFGRAYLTDGWATRLLAEMFATFTVLFVGYSHDDPVMHYLSRSFVGRTKRFALTPPGREAYWRSLGIVPVQYPVRPTPDEHLALTDALAAWVGLVRMGALDHEQRISRLVGSPPPLDPAELDYIKAAVRDVVTLRFFVKHARSVDWLKWVAEQGLLAPLLTHSEALDERDRLLCAWLIGEFAITHADEVIAILRGSWPNLNGILAHNIAFELSYHRPPASPQVKATWVGLLTSAASPSWGMAALNQVLRSCKTDGDAAAAMLLFAFLTRPSALIRERIVLEPAADASTSRIEVVLRGDHHELAEAWERVLKPALPALHASLLSILSTRLVEANRILQAVGSAGGAWDPWSYSRSAIEPHEQDAYPDAEDVLISATRDVLEWYQTHAPARARAIIEEWTHSDALLLQRVAVHGMCEDPALSADLALSTIESRSWLSQYHLKHEVFRLMQIAYPAASDTSRKAFVESAARLPTSLAVTEDPEAQQSRAYGQFNLAVWLVHSAPTCAYAARFLGALTADHPDFAEREYPDLDHWGGGVHAVVPKSPISVADLLALDLGDKERIDWILSYAPREFVPGGFEREGLLETVRDAASQQPGWGLLLAERLAVRKAWNNDVWRCIVAGWQRAKLSGDAVTDVFQFLSANRDADQSAGDAIADLLEALLEDDKAALTGEHLEIIERLSDRLFASDRPAPEIGTPGREEWLVKALNHRGGRIAQTWLLLLSKRRASAGDAWNGLPEEYRKRFAAAFTSSSRSAVFARIMLARALHFLHAIDSAWTNATVVPLLDVARDEETATQMWHGYFGSGRWNDALFAAIRPQLEKLFPLLDGRFAELREPIAGYLASVAAYSLLDPWHEGWLFSFIRDADAESRKSWATHVDRTLEALTAEAAARVWTQWIGDYWKTRLMGVPVPFSTEERGAMLSWVIGLRTVFAPAVALAVQTPVPPQMDGMLFYRLHEGKFAAFAPDSTTNLLLHVLSGLHSLEGMGDDVDKMARELITLSAPKADLRRLCEELARLGYAGAADIRALL